MSLSWPVKRGDNRPASVMKTQRSGVFLSREPTHSYAPAANLIPLRLLGEQAASSQLASMVVLRHYRHGHISRVDWRLGITLSGEI
jgi:hypothetical protein